MCEIEPDENCTIFDTGTILFYVTRDRNDDENGPEHFVRRAIIII